MGKKRNSVKTGDKAIYKKNAPARAEAAAGRHGNNKATTSDPNMYDDVDVFHKEQDQNFIQLEREAAAEDDDAGNTSGSDDNEGEEAVMDLGVGGESSSSDDDSDDDSDSYDGDGAPNATRQSKGPAPASSSSDDNDDDDDDDEEEVEDVRDWGRKKSDYYHGDTADLELGQDEEDAFLEEEAAKEVQEARYKEMDEEDFALSDDDDDDDDSDNETKQKGRRGKQQEAKASKKERVSTTSKISSLRDVSKLSSRDRRKLLEKQHPGLLQILSHFSETLQDLNERTSVATSALFGDNPDESDETAEVCSVS